MIRRRRYSRSFGWAMCSSVLIFCCSSPAATWHVNVASGSDANTGQAADAAFKTIQKACDRVSPGDVVTVYPGVYCESVQLKRAGAPGKPIVFKADAVEEGRVIITGADRAIREGKVEWKLVDVQLQLYSAPLDHQPTRALYSGADLYPYPDLARLKQFSLTDKMSGPKHGFAYSDQEKRVYVRLNTSGRYGPADPSKQVMSFSPYGIGRSWAGTAIAGPEHYNFGVLSDGPAHVVIDGFTFETPGIAGVYVAGSDVIVRNCWFLGCKTGVGGRQNPKGEAKLTAAEYKTMTNRVTIEYCNFTQYPAFSDARDALLEAKRAIAAGKPAPEGYFWWQRKGSSSGSQGLFSNNTYEVGIASFIGQDWEIHHNLMSDVFEALSYVGAGTSENLRFHDNIVAGAADNAIETENHAANMRIYRNLFVDCFEPVSWQPLNGLPWPGPIYVYENVIYDTPENATLWDGIWPSRSWLKAGADPKNWEAYNKHMKDVPKDAPADPPAPGFLVYNNTVYFPAGNFLTTLGQNRQYRNFRLFNNIFVCRQFNLRSPTYRAPAMEFSHNLYAPPPATQPSAVADLIAGEGGTVLAGVEAIGWVAPPKDFSLKSGSPAVGAGISLPVAPEAFKDIGAVPFGKTWSPPQVGPQPR